MDELLETKICGICDREQPIDEFRLKKSPNKFYRQNICKSCERARNRKYHSDGRRDTTKAYVKNRRHQLARNFGLTLESYNKMLKAQEYKCAVCGESETALGNNGEIKALAVDHDHETGAIRQLLCARCNQGLGCFRDSPKLLSLASAYLVSHKEGDI